MWKLKPRNSVSFWQPAQPIWCTEICHQLVFCITTFFYQNILLMVTSLIFQRRQDIQFSVKREVTFYPLAFSRRDRIVLQETETGTLALIFAQQTFHSARSWGPRAENFSDKTIFCFPFFTACLSDLSCLCDTKQRLTCC